MYMYIHTVSTNEEAAGWVGVWGVGGLGEIVLLYTRKDRFWFNYLLSLLLLLLLLLSFF